ncbi:MAG: hypothetical protein HFJ50_09850 [Clostridia bacterium]|nr:hypothetical protein [Clostridia bacterium]
MKLDFFNNLADGTKSHSFTLQFIDELTEYLNNIKENITEKQIKQDLTDFLCTNELIAKNKISYTFLSDFYEKRNDILKEYSNSRNIYYVSWNNNIDDKYEAKNIYKINEYFNGNIVSTFHLSGKDLPKLVQEGMILEKSGNKYIIDTKSTNAISKKLKEASKEIVNLQENHMKQYRTENDLYVVVEKCLNSAYLQNINTNIVFEETSFSDDVFNLLHNDVVVSFKDGKYVYEDEITRDWMNSFISIDEHNEVLQKLMAEPNFSKIDFENTIFSIISRENNYTLLSYGESQKNILKVPNKLISYWVDDNSILYYDKEDKLFYKQV